MNRIATLLFLALLTSGFQFWGQEEKANRAYRRGDYEKAVDRYREALRRGDLIARLNYNLGTALLQLDESEEARERLMEGLRAQAPELRARAFYNLGNALVRGSEGSEQETEYLKAAVDSYQRSLLLDPESQEVRWNLELALHRLNEAEESASMTGQQPEQDVPPQGEGAGQQQRPNQGGSQTNPFQPDTQPLDGAAPQFGDEPLTKELAEQILRAVEERERGLQREKLRRQRKRAAGPDW